MEKAGLLTGVRVGRDEEFALVLVLEQEQPVQADVVDDDTKGEIPASSFIAERDQALEANPLNLDLEHDRLTGRDREFERAGR
jgi:hypothetical protein